MESFYSHFEKLVGTLSDRSQAIVRERFGVTDGRAKTFEEIGKKYNVTGDRVQRIIRDSLKDIRAYDKTPFQEIGRQLIASALRSKSGVMSEVDLLKTLGKDDVKETAALHFFLECFSATWLIKENACIERSYALKSFSLDEWKKMIQRVAGVLDEEKKSIRKEALLKNIAQTYGSRIKDKKLSDYLAVSKEVRCDALGTVKRSSWSDTSSKGSAKMQILQIPLSFVVLVVIVGVCIYLFVSFLPKESAPVKFEAIQQESEVLPVNAVEKDQQEIALASDATKTIVFADRKARGSVIIYNEYSGRPQVLVASTRLLSREGKLFRLVKKVTIPGMTKVGDTIEPGAVEADVIADQPGEDYNIEPTSFTIPGFEGNVKKYGKFYARSSNAMSGGEASGSDATDGK